LVFFEEADDPPAGTPALTSTYQSSGATAIARVSQAAMRLRVVWGLAQPSCAPSGHACAPHAWRELTPRAGPVVQIKPRLL